MELTSENVECIFMDCLFKDNEDHTDYVKVQGITITVGFHPERLASHKEEVQVMLQDLPDDFQNSKGGGQSFLNACNDKNGRQWTGLHQRMEQLFLLGIGLKIANWQFPREMWTMFPGSMPYVTIQN